MKNNKTVFEKAMTSLLSKVDSTEKFVLDQAPEICRQLVAEKTAVEKMDAVVSGIFLLIFPFLTFLMIEYALLPMSDKDSGYGVLFSIFAALFALSTIPSFIAFYSSIQNLCRLRIAPKIFLLRQFRDLVSNKND